MSAIDPAAAVLESRRNMIMSADISLVKTAMTSLMYQLLDTLLTQRWKQGRDLLYTLIPPNNELQMRAV